MLYDMFPEECNGTIEAIKRISDSVRDNFDQMKKDWGANSLITPEYWLDCALQCKRLFDTGKRPERSLLVRSCAGEHFFFFTIHCIEQYAHS